VDLKKKDKLVLWPIYFDSTKTRLEGRRVPKNLAVPAPKLIELQDAVKQAGFQPEVIVDVEHPSVPWQKTGMILVPKRDSKTQILQRVAERLFKIRNRSRSTVGSRKGLN
jgi:signal recognition particle subunit SRP19